MTQQQELNNVIPWIGSLYATNRHRWKKFMTHDFDAPDREAAYQIVARLLDRHHVPLIEVGFGQAYDFQHFFKPLHDGGWIVYSGFDITPGFVDLACQEYPTYDFRVGGFTDLPAACCDIIFTRHTLMHINRDLYPVCLTKFLRATRDIAIISWALAPQGNGGYQFDGEHRVHWNTHSKQVTDSIIEREGFVCSIVDISIKKKLRKLYQLQRRTT